MSINENAGWLGVIQMMLNLGSLRCRRRVETDLFVSSVFVVVLVVYSLIVRHTVIT